MDRLALAAIVDAFEVEKLAEGDERIVLKLDKKIAPYKFAVLPLNKKVHGEAAEKVYAGLVDQG